MHDNAMVGCDISEVPTPSLVLVRNVLDANIQAFQDLADKAKVRTRPHAKGHKSIEIARRQIDAGAVGICCQRLSEAEVFAAAGIGNILLTNEVVDYVKLERACQLARTCQLIFVVDSIPGVDRLVAAASRVGVQIDVLVEINVGQNRCGAATVQDAVSLAELISRCPNLTLKGIQAYHGKLQHVPGWNARRSEILKAMEKLQDLLEVFRAKGLCSEIVTGGGTGTAEIDCDLKLINEIQAGSYAVMDMQYQGIGGRTGSKFDLFHQAIFVIAQVISRTGNEWCVIDAGLKALSSDASNPEVVGHGSGTFSFGGDEHGILDIRDMSCRPSIGDRLRLVPGHCDTTINLHDRYVVVEGERVVAAWAVDARE